MGKMANNIPEHNDHCQHFVIRKKRYCRMTLKKGEQFCGEHKPVENRDVPGEDAQRVVCPYDGKHTCYVSQLAKHLKKCNAKPKSDHPPFIIPGINSSTEACTKEQKVALAEISDADLLKLIEKIKHVATGSIPAISEKILDHPVLLAELKKPENGANARKHLLQNSSLLAHMQSAGVIKENTCFIEFGAGKGQLSYWLGSAAQQVKKSMHLLVDRASNRHKFDNRKHEGRTQEARVQRIRADIADLCLSRVDGIGGYEHVVAVSKHLCGAATDLALRCLANSVAAGGDGECPLNVSGILFAFCCHHRCEWTTYVGKSFLAAEEFSAGDFNAMCGIVSWATCGSGRNRTWEPSAREDSEHVPGSDRNHRLQLSQEERKTIGRQCKLIMDYGRLQFLKEIGFKVDLVYYIHEEISPENLCLIAVR